MTQSQRQEERQLDHDLLNLLSIASPEQKKSILTLLQEQVKGETDEILTKKSKYKLLQPITKNNVISDPSYLREFLKTFISIGINDDTIASSNVLENIRNIENQASMYNFSKNYKEWLGKKLFLSEDEIEQKSVEDVDNQALKYVNYAIKHIDKHLSNFSPEEQKLLKSEYFTQIHNGETPKTVFNLLKLWNTLRVRKNKLLKEEALPTNRWINYKNIYKQIDIASFEIQRIFALTLLYIDREKNQNYQHTTEDIDFIIKKLTTIVASPVLNDGIIDMENPLYHLVHSKTMYWTKENNTYILWETPTDSEENAIQMDSIRLKWKTRNFKKHNLEVEVLHIASRMKKWPFSAVDKVVRKDFDSFNQIMDHKGFIFVVENFNEGKKLLKIIENELGTLQSSWIEEPVFMSNSGNENTNSHYNSMKWIIKIPYKWKLIRDFFEHLESHFRNNSELLKRINLIKSTCLQNRNPTIETIERLLDIELREWTKVKELFRDLKSKFNSKEYNIEIEIQVFDVQNYMKAEVDKNSPAHHEHYKNRQIIYTIPKYYPPEIYGEKTIRNLIDQKLKK